MSLPKGSFIASGPVILEEGKVLLNREHKPGDRITDWYFPGGMVEDFDLTLEQACAREAREEMGIEIEIIRPLRTIVKRVDGTVAILVHFLARRTGDISPAENIAEWAWHDIRQLPDHCADNVKEIVADIVAEQV